MKIKVEARYLTDRNCDITTSKEIPQLSTNQSLPDWIHCSRPATAAAAAIAHSLTWLHDFYTCHDLESRHSLIDIFYFLCI